MIMKLKRQIKTIDYLSKELFDEELTKIFNDDTIRITDIQYRVYTENNQVHYVAFIIYEYSIPDSDYREDFNEQKSENGEQISNRSI